MPKSTKTKIKQEKNTTASTKQTKNENTIWDIFKFGESYTSLILGIVVVIIATVLLLTFVKNKAQNSSIKLEAALPTILKEQNTVTKSQNLTKTEEKIVAAKQTNNKITPTAIPTTKPTVKPTEKPVVSNTKTISGTTYTVRTGDTLWSIAEKRYKSGYNWVDIKNANNITNPDLLFTNTKLTLPNVEPKITTIEQNTTSKQAIKKDQVNNSIKTNKITGTSYTIAKGDTLWDIAVRAYGDGYAWTKISKANKLSNPGVIHSGNKINIPRG